MMIIVILININFLGLIATGSRNLNQVYSDSILPKTVQGTRPYIFPSNMPVYYNSSVTGRLHVFFQVELTQWSYATALYHIYEHENETWSSPELIFSSEELAYFGVNPSEQNVYEHISAIDSTPKGFRLYITYFSREIGNVFHCKSGLIELEYDEMANQWFDQKSILNNECIAEYLNQSQEEIRWKIHALFLNENKTLYVVWEYASEEYVTKIDQEENCESQPLQDLPRYAGFPMLFYKQNDTLTLYDSYLRFRTVLLANGSWSKWKNATLASQHGFYPNFFPNHWSGSTLVQNRYFFGRDNINSQYILFMYDLAQGDQLQQRTLSIPYGPYSDFDNFSPNLGFELNVSASNELLFVVGLIMNESIELWQYNDSNIKWTQISRLEVNDSLVLPLSSFDLNMVKVIKDGTNWRLFWGGSNFGVNFERYLYTITYDAVVQKWGSITRIMGGLAVNRFNTTPWGDLIVIISSFIAIIVLTRNYRFKRNFG